MKKLNRNNADIKKILNKKVGVVCDSKEKELDFRKWAKQYVDCVDEDYVYTNCGNGICIKLEYDGLKWDYIKYFLEDNYSIYEWEIVEEENTYTKKIKDAKPLTEEKKEILKSCLPQKTYTLKDVVENEGKIYKIAGSSSLYKYENGKLLTNVLISSCWTTNVLNLKELLEAKFVEYKPEPKKITFGEALKEMEQGKVCRSLFSNRFITICGTQFVDVRNGEYTKLALSEIKGKWVVLRGKVFEW